MGLNVKPWGTHWPKDTDTVFHIARDASLSEILGAVRTKWGADINLDLVTITPEEIKVDCHAYDIYESSDHCNFLIIELANQAAEYSA